MRAKTYKRICMEILENENNYREVSGSVLPDSPFAALEQLLEEYDLPVNIRKSLMQLKTSSYFRFTRIYCLPKMSSIALIKLNVVF